MNIQRGRDHGLPDFNSAREGLGLVPIRFMSDLTENEYLADSMNSVYSNLEQVDLWVGALCEDDLPGSMVGETCQRILLDQFARLRDGDRFYYESSLPREMVQMIQEQTLSRIIKRNTGIGNELSENVFVKGSESLRLEQSLRQTPRPQARDNRRQRQITGRSRR